MFYKTVLQSVHYKRTHARVTFYNSIKQQSLFFNLVYHSEMLEYVQQLCACELKHFSRCATSKKLCCLFPYQVQISASFNVLRQN